MNVFSNSSQREVKVIAVTGPTATGKTALAVYLAGKIGGEIVSVDSRQVYRGLDLGTGKDLEEYGDVPYHLINVADPATEEYNLHRFCTDAFNAVKDISSRGKVPVLCGGTALYMAALLQGYNLPGRERDHSAIRTGRDLTAAASFAPDIKLDALVLGVLYPRQEVRERIAQRLDKRFEAGMMSEVQHLLANGVSPEKMEYFGLEYREISRCITGKCDFETMHRTLLDRIRQFAKRQDIFFRKMEREGVEIRWISKGDKTESLTLCRDFLAGVPLPPVTFRLADFHNPPSQCKNQKSKS